MSDKLDFVINMVKSCAVPELKQDLDSFPIESGHFKEYWELLENQLPILYDFLQQNETWLLDCKERDIQEAYASLLLLLCEITAPTAIYAMENKYLVTNGNRLLQLYLRQCPDNIESKILMYYHSKLRSDCWKRHLGAVHGFMRYLELRYSKQNEQSAYCGLMSLERLTFCLSVALNFQECHEPVYKQFSAKIFQLMMQRANSADILRLNIHSVIYDSVFKNVHLMDTVQETADTWNCLFDCLNFFEEDSFSWNKADDMMETLLRNITLAPNTIVSICLLEFVTRIGFFFSVNRKEIATKLSVDLKDEKMLMDCRILCAANTAYTSFRWAKSILDTISSEAHKLMAGENICKQLLQEMHRCYLVCILPIPLPVAQPHLVIFWNKFTSALMKAIVIHKKEMEVVNLVKAFLETFLWQIKCSSYGKKNADVLLFHDSFEELLKNDIFIEVR